MPASISIGCSGSAVTSCRIPACAAISNQRALVQAVRALTLVLEAGNFGLVVFDVGEAPADAIRRLPFTTWLRLHRMVEGSQTVCLLVGSDRLSRSPRGLSLNASALTTGDVVHVRLRVLAGSVAQQMVTSPSPEPRRSLR